MVDGLTTIPMEAKQYYDKKLLMRAMPVLAIAEAAQKRSIPANSGNQVSYRRFNQIPTATTPLLEGVTPAAAALSTTEITGTVQQYGNYVALSDQIKMMGIDANVGQIAEEVLGDNAGISIEGIIRQEVVTGTSVVYATGASRAAQSSANPITLALVRKAVRTLRTGDALPVRGARGADGQGGTFWGWIHTRMWYDLLGDTAVQNYFTYGTTVDNMMFTYKVPILGEVNWVVSNQAPVFAGQGAGSQDVYGAIIFGEEAFGVCDVAGTGKFQTIVKPLGSGGTSDPLDQRSTVGWKSLQLPKILNNNFLCRIEAGVTA